MKLREDDCDDEVSSCKLADDVTPRARVASKIVAPKMSNDILINPHQ
jgi:hypothetical protein